MEKNNKNEEKQKTIFFFEELIKKMNYPCLSTTAKISPVLKINKIKFLLFNFWL